MAYNLETILAEKFETIITRSVTNTRMRDFYDIYILTLTQTFDYGNFRMALKKTVEKRGTIKQMDAIEEVIQAITNSTVMSGLWQQYQRKYDYAATVNWDDVMRAVKKIIENPLRI